MLIIRWWKGLNATLRILLLIALFFWLYFWIQYQYNIDASIYFYGIWTSIFTAYMMDFFSIKDESKTWWGKLLRITGFYILMVIVVWFLVLYYNLRVYDVVVILVSALIGIIFGTIYHVLTHGFQDVAIRIK